MLDEFELLRDVYANPASRMSLLSRGSSLHLEGRDLH